MEGTMNSLSCLFDQKFRFERVGECRRGIFVKSNPRFKENLIVKLKYEQC